MADEVKNEENAQEEPVAKHTDADVAKIVKSRLKKVHEEKDALRAQLEAMQAAAPVQASSGVPESEGGNVIPTLSSPLSDEGPLTQAQMQQLLQHQYEQQLKQQQEAQLQQIALHHMNTMAQIKNEDNKFNDLYDEVQMNNSTETPKRRSVLYIETACIMCVL